MMCQLPAWGNSKAQCTLRDGRVCNLSFFTLLPLADGMQRMGQHAVIGQFNQKNYMVPAASVFAVSHHALSARGLQIDSTQYGALVPESEVSHFPGPRVAAPAAP